MNNSEAAVKLNLIFEENLRCLTTHVSNCARLVAQNPHLRVKRPSRELLEDVMKVIHPIVIRQPRSEAYEDLISYFAAEMKF
jgi:hypothetical protein